VHDAAFVAIDGKLLAFVLDDATLADCLSRLDRGSSPSFKRYNRAVWA